jgi:hypothetical protein
LKQAVPDLPGTAFFLNIDPGKIEFSTNHYARVFLLLRLKLLMMEDQNQQQNQLNIEISEEVAEGEYANLAIITHSHAEFVIDFVNVMPGTPKSKVKSRIILTPQHAKRFMKALTENIQRFETANGKIKDLEDVQIPMTFGGPTAQA